MTDAVLEFSGSAPPPQPLTWGQYAIWAAIGRTAPNDHYFNLGRTLTPPDRCQPLPVQAALRAIAAVLGLHPTLRSRVRTIDGRPTQVADAQGRIPVPVLATVAGEADTVAARLLEALTARGFDYGGEPPVRPGLVTVDGSVTRIVLGLSHLATDGFGADVMLRDLRLALLGRVAPPPGDPLALVAEQHSPAGRRRSADVVAFWERTYRELPATMFATERGEPEWPRWRVGRLTSRALGLAAGALAARYQASVSTVLLAATAALVAADSGEPRVGVLTIVNNRFTPQQHNLVSTLSQEGLFVLDTAGADDFRELIGPAWHAAMRAYRVGQYDQAALDAVLAGVGAERGEPIHPYCCFNDMRPADRTPAVDVGAQTVREALPDTDFAWGTPQEKVGCRFCAHVTSAGPALTYQVTGDTRFLPAPRIEAFLYVLQWLLVTATEREVRLAELPGLLAGAAA